MRAVSVIAINTYRELIRDRILYGILVFAVLLVLLSLVAGQLSFAEQNRITIDLGLAGIELSIIILSIFSGGTLVFKEIEKRTLLTLFARPISRFEFLLGKYCGLVGVILTALIGLSAVLFTMLLLMGWKFDPRLFTVLYGFFIESCVLISITMLFGVVSKPVLTITFVIGVFLIGRSMDSLTFFAAKSSSDAFYFFSGAIQYVFPNFARFDWKAVMTYDAPIDINLVAMASIYALSWVVSLEIIAGFVFRRRDIA